MASVIEMTFLYDARCSIVLLRPKNEVKLATQSAEKWNFMGKWVVPTGAIFIHEVVVIGFVTEFLMTACLQTPK